MGERGAWEEESEGIGCNFHAYMRRIPFESAIFHVARTRGLAHTDRRRMAHTCFAATANAALHRGNAATVTRAMNSERGLNQQPDDRT